jgi:hypothetical protein
LQVLVVPYIEDNPAAMEVYQADEGKFWVRLFTPGDAFSEINMIVVDGAHRLYVSNQLKLKEMRTLFARPTISICQQTALGHSRNRMTTEGHVKQTDADNMYSFVQLVNDRKFTQVFTTCVHFLLDPYFYEWLFISCMIITCLCVTETGSGHPRRGSKSLHRFHVEPRLECGVGPVRRL